LRGLCKIEGLRVAVFSVSLGPIPRRAEKKS